jgi:hypothetical protein
LIEDGISDRAADGVEGEARGGEGQRERARKLREFVQSIVRLFKRCHCE